MPLEGSSSSTPGRLEGRASIGPSSPSEPVVPSFLLTEAGDSLLTEAGDSLLLEAA